MATQPMFHHGPPWGAAANIGASVVLALAVVFLSQQLGAMLMECHLFSGT